MYSVTQSQCRDNVKTMTQKIDEIKTNVNDLKVSLASLPEKLIEKLDEKYADKRTEKTVDKLTWLVISCVVIAILALIFKFDNLR